MTEADIRLKGLFAEDEPPARDPAFSAVVMARIARRRLWGELALHSSVTLAGGAVLWAVWPSLSPAVASLSQGLAPVAACLVLALATAAVIDRRIGAALGLES